MTRRSVTRFCLLLTLWACALSENTHADTLDLTAYRGKVVYLDFWASWCTPCRRSFPWLDGLTRKYAGRDLVVIGVNVDQDRDLAEKFLDGTPASSPLFMTPAA